MPGEIKVPGIGEVKKGYVYAGAAFVGIAGIVVYMRRRSAAAASAANTAASTSGSSNMVTDPAGNQCASLDPSSGYCPGTPEDEQYQEQQASAAEGEGYDEYPGGAADLITDADGNQCVALDPSTGLCPASESTTPASGSAAAVTTNAQWVVEAENDLGNTSTVQAALGYALSGSPVTAAQKTIFMEAVGLLGAPPQGYPPLNVTGSNSGGGSASGSSTVTVPNVTHQRVDQANAVLSEMGLSSTLNTTRKPGVAYYVGSQSPSPGTKVAPRSSVKLTITTKTGK